MNQVNKIHLFDVCVDGNIEKFRALINPMYDHFSRFYKSYKESFVNDSEAVENIIFENNSDVASFTVVCESEGTKKSTDKTINIVTVDQGYQFQVQPNKGYDDISTVP